jgi:hypothetical protein
MYAFVNRQMKVHIAKADINICSAEVPATCRLTDFAVEDVSRIKANELPSAVEGIEPPRVLFKCWAVRKLKTHQESLMKRREKEGEASELQENVTLTNRSSLRILKKYSVFFIKDYYETCVWFDPFFLRLYL